MPEAPRGLRERKKFATHRTLTLTAVRLIAERGLDQVTVEDISSEAGVSARTFFNYFASKEDAVLIAFPDQVERTTAVARRLLDVPAEVEPLPALVSAFRAEIEVIEENPEEWLARMAIITANPSLISRVVAAQMPAEQILLAAVAERTGQDPVKDLYPGLLLGVIGSAMHAAIRRWCAFDGKKPIAGLIDEACAAVAAGLPAPPSPTAGKRRNRTISNEGVL